MCNLAPGIRFQLCVSIPGLTLEYMPVKSLSLGLETTGTEPLKDRLQPKPYTGLNPWARLAVYQASRSSEKPLFFR